MKTAKRAPREKYQARNGAARAAHHISAKRRQQVLRAAPSVASVKAAWRQK